MKAKPLKIYNGRGFTGRGDHLYICAKSRRDAARLYVASERIRRGVFCAVDDFDTGRADREIRDYFCEGCWGNSMKGITPERGVWYSKEDLAKPERIL